MAECDAVVRELYTFGYVLEENPFWDWEAEVEDEKASINEA